MKNIALSSLSLATLILACAAPALAADAGYAVQQTWPLDGAGKWDYAAVDQARHHLFLTRGERVQVLDLPSGKVLGQIDHTEGVHGVAFAQDLKLGFTSNGRGNSVSVFDLDTLKVKQEVNVGGSNPDAILYEPGNQRLYTFNGKSANVSVIDARTMKLLGTIDVSGRPEFAVSDGAGRIYLNVEDKNEIDVIDTAAMTMTARWPLAGCEEPTGLAFDKAHGRLFSVCKNKTMVVTDAASGRAVAKVAIGEHADAVIYDAARALVFSSNGDAGGTLSVIRQDDADHYALLTQLPTLQGAKTMAMDAASGRVYLPALKDQVFSVIVAAPK